VTFRPSQDAPLPDMTVREAASRLAEPDSTALLLDVREPYEYVPRHAQGAVNIPMSEFVARIAEVPQDREVLVICEHGSRSLDVVRYLMRQGYTQAINVDGGTEMWESAGLPMEYPGK
jgi:rhodanese-related sulfurtransferase